MQGIMSDIEEDRYHDIRPYRDEEVRQVLERLGQSFELHRALVSYRFARYPQWSQRLLARIVGWQLAATLALGEHRFHVIKKNPMPTERFLAQTRSLQPKSPPPRKRHQPRRLPLKKAPKRLPKLIPKKQSKQRLQSFRKNVSLPLKHKKDLTSAFAR